MKAQSFQVRTIKNQIAACLKLIAAKVKSAILRLIDLENQLEVAMNQQSEVKLYLDSISHLNQKGSGSGEECYNSVTRNIAENRVVELCEKLNIQPSKELLDIAFNSIRENKAAFQRWNFEQDVRKHLDYNARCKEWEKEAEAKWAEAEKEYDNNPINRIIAEIEENELVANLWEKYGKVRIYVNGTFGEKMGYIDLTEINSPKFCLDREAAIAKTITLEILG